MTSRLPEQPCFSGRTCTDRALPGSMFARQPAELTARLHKACVGIAGAGGLGTVVAENLARAGIGKLIIADFDSVEPSNLNRQRYTVSQVGMPKAEALAANLLTYNPWLAVAPVRERVTSKNCGRIFAGCGIVAECFDRAENKAELVYGLRMSLPDCIIVTASGLAGIGSGNAIKARMITEKLFIIGDTVSCADEGLGLVASRVGIAASMQAHIIIRLLSGEEEC